MNRKTALSIGLVAVATAVPVNVQALSARAGLEACAEAMVQEIGNDREVRPEYRLSRDSTIGAGKRGQGVWHLDVRNPVDNEVVARADCRVDRQAEVTELTVLPLTAEDAKIRAYKVN